MDTIEADILVVSGKTWAVAASTHLAPMNLSSSFGHRRGIIVNPEGYVNVFENEGAVKIESNAPLDLVRNCERIVKNGFRGIILTNSSFVVEAIDVYTRQYRRSARFFLAEDPWKIIDCTHNLEAIYKTFVRGFHQLDAAKSALEENIASGESPATSEMASEVSRVADGIHKDTYTVIVDGSLDITKMLPSTASDTVTGNLPTTHEQ